MPIKLTAVEKAARVMLALAACILLYGALCAAGCAARSDMAVRAEAATDIAAEADVDIRGHADASLVRVANNLAEETRQNTEQSVATPIKAAGDVQSKVETVSTSTVGVSGPWIVGLIVGLAAIGTVAFLVAKYFKSQIECQIKKHGYNEGNWSEKERKRANGCLVVTEAEVRARDAQLAGAQ